MSHRGRYVSEAFYLGSVITGYPITLSVKENIYRKFYAENPRGVEILPVTSSYEI